MLYLIAKNSTWQIPAYAQTMLWVRQGAYAVQVSGPRGAFALDGDETGLALAWGTAEGPLLAEWPDATPRESLVLGWQGVVGVAGFVERLHVFEMRGLEILVAEVEGDVLPLDYQRLPTLAAMRAGRFQRPDDPDSLRRATYTFIALADSVYAEYLHHALVSGLAVDCFAALGDQAGRWHEIVGLPLLLEAVSLLAPG